MRNSPWRQVEVASGPPITLAVGLNPVRNGQLRRVGHSKMHGDGAIFGGRCRHYSQRGHALLASFGGTHQRTGTIHLCRDLHHLTGLEAATCQDKRCGRMRRSERAGYLQGRQARGRSAVELFPTISADCSMATLEDVLRSSACNPIVTRARTSMTPMPTTISPRSRRSRSGSRPARSSRCN